MEPLLPPSALKDRLHQAPEPRKVDSISGSVTLSAASLQLTAREKSSACYMAHVSSVTDARALTTQAEKKKNKSTQLLFCFSELLNFTCGHNLNFRSSLEAQMLLSVCPTAAANGCCVADITEVVLCVCWQESSWQPGIEPWQETTGTKTVVGWQVKLRPTSKAARLPLT